MRIAIAGGGIGGMATALAFARRGAEVTVYEQAEALREVGAGIQISPNGFAVLRGLGLAEAARRVSVANRAVSLRDYKSLREVHRIDLGVRDDAGAFRLFHRADLLGLLAEAAEAAGVRLELGAAVAGAESGAHPRLLFKDAGPATADLVIGADGLRSALRADLNPPANPEFTGQVAWRALAPNTIQHPPEARVHMGPERHVVTYPLRGGDVVNIVAVEERTDWREEGWRHAGDPDDLRARFAMFGGDVGTLLKEVDGVHLWALFLHPVAEVWQAEGLALVGDAAHPTLPFLAQGANLALEDAWVLADCVMTGQGLAAYQTRRRARAAAVVARASGNAWKFHLSNPLIRSAAHLALGIGGRIAPGVAARQFDEIYRYDVTRP